MATKTRPAARVPPEVQQDNESLQELLAQNQALRARLDQLESQLAEARAAAAAPAVVEPTGRRLLSPGLGRGLVAKYPEPDTDYVIYRGRFKSVTVRVRGRELVYPMAPPLPEPTESEDSPGYLRKYRASQRLVGERTGTYMEDGATVYIFGQQGDPTRITEDGAPWHPLSLAQHLLWFEEANLKALQRDEGEAIWECVMTPEMKRRVAVLMKRRSREEEARAALWAKLIGEEEA